MIKTYYKYFIFSFILTASNVLFAQSIIAIDSVPRDRLVTDKELFELLDSNTKNLISVDGSYNIETLSEYFRNRNTPKYFFNSNTLMDMVDLYLTKYPNEKNRIASKVSEFQTSYGNDIDWLLPSVDLHKRALTPNSIRYNARFPLAYEYSMNSLINKEEVGLSEILAQLKDFIKDYELGEAESEENDVFERFYAGHRTRNLLFAHNVNLANQDYKWTDQVYMLKVFLLHGAKLIDVCNDFNWGNHQLHGLAGLYEMSLMYPEFPIMKLWNEMALKTIMEHIDKEIMDDGFQFERASHYFKLDIMNYFRIYKISKINGIELPSKFNERFHKMFDAIVNLAMPNKSLPVLQDAQGTYRPQNEILENNDAAELSDLSEALYMTIGSTVFSDPVYKFFGDQSIPSELFWFFTLDEQNNYEKLVASKPTVGSVGLEDSKYYVMRTGWEDDSYYMLIDGGLAKYKPDHTHGGILGLVVNIGSQSILPSYRVKYSEPTYRYLKNSMVKNVALADNILQGHSWKSNNARTGFGHWEELPQPESTNWIAGEYFDYYSGTHNGFKKDSVNYRRSVIFFKPYFWFVIDNFEAESIHSYQQLWQGEFETLANSNGIVKQIGNNKFYIIQSDFTYMDIESYSKYGYKSIKFEKEGVANYSFSTVLYPTTGENHSEPIVREYERSDYKQVVVQNGSTKSSYYVNKGKELKLDEINTDANFVCAIYKDEKLVSFLVYDGSYCNLENVKAKVENKSSFEVKVDKEGIVEITKY